MKNLPPSPRFLSLRTALLILGVLWLCCAAARAQVYTFTSQGTMNGGFTANLYKWTLYVPEGVDDSTLRGVIYMQNGSGEDRRFMASVPWVQSFARSQNCAFLASAHTFTGSVFHLGGTLHIAANAPSGAPGALGNSTGSVSVGASWGTTTAEDLAVLTEGNVTVARGITVNAITSATSTVLIGASDSASPLFSGAITASRNIALTAPAGGIASFGGVISGAGAVTVQSGVGLAFAISTAPGSHDKLDITGALSLAANDSLTVTVPVGGLPATSTYTLLTAAGGITGTIDTLHLPAGWSGSLAVSGNNLTVTALPAVPSAPDAPTTTAASQTQINLAWTDVAIETGYLVQCSTTPGSGFAQIASLAANTTSYSDTALPAATTYFYRVRAANPTGNSAYSNEASTSTQGSTTRTWTGATSGAWSLAGNWDGSAAIPAFADLVSFPAVTNQTITLGADRTVTSATRRRPRLNAANTFVASLVRLNAENAGYRIVLGHASALGSAANPVRLGNNDTENRGAALLLGASGDVPQAITVQHQNFDNGGTGASRPVLGGTGLTTTGRFTGSITLDHNTTPTGTPTLVLRHETAGGVVAFAGPIGQAAGDTWAVSIEGSGTALLNAATTYTGAPPSPPAPPWAAPARSPAP